MSSSAAAAGGLHGPPSPRRLRLGDQGADDADSTTSRLAGLAHLQLQGTFDSAGIDDFSDPRIDLFLADRHTPPQRLRHLLAAAWDIDPLTTLKLACHLRGKEGFFAGAAVWIWVHRNHPRTLAGNLSAFADLGFLNDFPELLHRLVQDADAEEAKATTITRKRARNDDDPNPAEAVRAAELGQNQAEATTPHLAEVALNMRRNDAAYCFLFDSVAEFFATNLRDNLNNPSGGIGPAAKWWCPLPDSPLDQAATLLHDAIACRIFPSDSEHADEHQRRQYVDSARHRLHQQVLILLKSIPEKNMMTRSVPVPAARWPLPHKLVHHFGREVSLVRRSQRAVQQWGTMLDDMRSKGSLTNCLAVCDVSIRGQVPKKVCVALGLLISQLSAGQWTHWVHAFNENCTPHLLPGIVYEEDVDRIRNMHCDKKFSLRRVFDWVLLVAKAASRNKQDIEPVKTIFVFSQRDFDEALVPACTNKGHEDFDPEAARPWKIEYDIICDKFKETNFEVPQVVFWNLKGQRSPALTSTSDGVMRLSGYSDDLMMLFLEKGGVVECEDEMYRAIAGEEYQKLKVHD